MAALFMILRTGPDGVYGGQPGRARAGRQAVSCKSTSHGQVNPVFVSYRGAGDVRDFSALPRFLQFFGNEHVRPS